MAIEMERDRSTVHRRPRPYRNTGPAGARRVRHRGPGVARADPDLGGTGRADARLVDPVSAIRRVAGAAVQGGPAPRPVGLGGPVPARPARASTCASGCSPRSSPSTCASATSSPRTTTRYLLLSALLPLVLHGVARRPTGPTRSGTSSSVPTNTSGSSAPGWRSPRRSRSSRTPAKSGSRGVTS